MANKTYKVLLEKLGGTNAATYIGNEGELFYDPTTTTLRVADGSTPGGTTTGGGSSSGDNSNTADVTIVSDSDGDAHTWVFKEDGKFLNPANTEMVVQLSGSDYLVVGVSDLNASRRTNSTTIYQPSDSGAYTEMAAYDDSFKSSKVRVVCDSDFTTPLSVDVELYDASTTTTYSFKKNALNVPIRNVLARPATPVGATGDKAGDVIFGDDALYVCKQNYDGSTAIWSKQAYNFSWT